MPNVTNLPNRMEKQLPTELVTFMQIAGEVAYGRGQRLCLVGGVVRDLLLELTNLDLDLVVEGDAINFAQQLIQPEQGKITTHLRFNTAKLQWNNWSVDLATARSETYAKPGVLPDVKPGSIDDDLFRRDFTINAMAIELSPNRYGELIDLCGGVDDLEHKLIRVLHDKSFTDDATRIWRGLRYEQRLDFQLERNTLQLLKRDIPMLDIISGDRIRHELELVLKETLPEKPLRRAEELNVLQRLNSFLKANGWLTETFKRARQLSSLNLPPVGLYLALLTYSLTSEENERLLSRLRLSKPLSQILRDTISIKNKLQSLADPELNPSDIYHVLHIYNPQAIMANSIASDSTVAHRHIQLFLEKLRYIRPALTGDDLIRMGIARGPNIKEILNMLHEARLDREITTKRDEEYFVNSWLSKNK